MAVILDKIAGWLGYTRIGNKEVWHEISSYNAWAGMRFTPEQALRISTVMSCVKVISEDLAALPLNVYKLLTNGGKEPATEHRLWYLLHNIPNSWQTSMEFREMMQGHVLLRGNAYAKIIPDERGYPEALEPIHPDTVKIERIKETKRLQYVVTEPLTRREETFDQQDIFHLRGFSLDGIKGLSPIGYAAESIGISLATDQFEASFYRNGANLGLTLEHPDTLGDQAHTHLKKQLQENFTGSSNAFKTLILQEGMKANKDGIGIKPEEAQFIEGRKFRVQDLCRIFRVPAYKVNDHEHSKYNNVEHLNIDYVSSCLRAWVVRWEQALERDLFMPDENHAAKFVIEGLLRGDIKTRTMALSLQKSHGVLSKNEWREIEGRNPVAGGDELKEAANIMGKNNTNQNGSNNQAALTSWAADIAERIASSEIRAIKRFNNLKSEAKNNFNEWLEGFYFGSHLKYVQKALEPICRDESRAEYLAHIIANKGMSRQGWCPESFLEFVISGRRQEIYEEIIDEVKNGD